MAKLELDYMEYSSDALAQAAYVTNASGGYLNTGGTITTDGLYKVHTFLLADSGTNFVAGANGNVQVLVVAGGGGGGGYHHAGGGGAGAMNEHAAKAVSAGNTAVVVGDGGAGGLDRDTFGSNGSQSSFGDIVAPGGGGGASYNYTPGNGDGVAGGSSGGSAAQGGTSGASTHDDSGGSTGYGNVGANKDNSTPGGGGGGAGGVGGVPTAGAGRANSITGSSVTYATGGLGVSSTPDATPGASNTGNGGNGSGYNYGTNPGGKGGSGIVIVRCLITDFSGTPFLQSYSEATIKTQGSYSLKGIADTTTSLNKTLTKTFAVNSDLTSVKNLKFDIYASRTGSNIKVGIYDTGGTTTEITPNIITANTWQTVNFDISAVTDANKDAISKIIITITNADVANTLYLDNFLIAQAIDVFGWVN